MFGRKTGAQPTTPPDALDEWPSDTPRRSYYVQLRGEVRPNGRRRLLSQPAVRPSLQSTGTGDVEPRTTLSRTDRERMELITTGEAVRAIMRFCLKEPLLGDSSGRPVARRYCAVRDGSLILRAYRIPSQPDICANKPPSEIPGSYRLDLWDNRPPSHTGASDNPSARHSVVPIASIGTSFVAPYKKGGIDNPHAVLWRTIVDGPNSQFGNHYSAPINLSTEAGEQTPLAETMRLNPEQLTDPETTLAFFNGVAAVMLSRIVHKR